jgi:hypothetical protein
MELSYALETDCGFSIVEGTKADQHLIDEGVLEYEVKRALDTMNRLNAERTMPLAYASLITLRDRNPTRILGSHH